jgi:hypothetical protein
MLCSKATSAKGAVSNDKTLADVQGFSFSMEGLYQVLREHPTAAPTSAP